MSGPHKIKVRWWIRFTVGSVPVRLALLFAFLGAAAALYSVGQVQGQVDQQTTDRHAALSANIRARFDDCFRLNEVRRGLRVVVSDSHSQLPPEQLKRIFPQLPQSYVDESNRIYREELAFFADDSCRRYANEALPKGQKVRGVGDAHIPPE